MVNHSELCQEASDIHRSKIYIFIMALVVILNSIGLVLLINTAIFLVKTKKISFNLRFLLGSITVALIGRDVLTAVRALYRIFLAIFVTDECGFISTNYFCVLESAITAVPFNVALYSFPVISAERLLATLFRKIDEKQIFKNLVFIAVVITVCEYFLAKFRYAG
uniref:G-protein coupled receptors family 1 profile domain-containing protein n=1 Tax=Panagrolaimus davidi TaxID=227884 RepID=A0A914PRK5_9BILA